MLEEAIWSVKCQNWSGKVAKKGYFSSFLDFSQRSIGRICSKCPQMYVFPCTIYWSDRIGCLISSRVSPKKNPQCECLLSFMIFYKGLWILKYSAYQVGHLFNGHLLHWVPAQVTLKMFKIQAQEGFKCGRWKRESVYLHR